MRNIIKRKGFVSFILSAILLISNSISVFADTKDNKVEYSVEQIKKEIVNYLNENIDNGNSNIEELINNFYENKDQDALTLMYKKVNQKAKVESTSYTLKNEIKLKFYTDGTFSIANSFDVNQLMTRSINWDTGRYTISETRYRWFGLKLYTIHSEGRFTFDNGVLNAYVYSGDYTNHFAGGFFNIRNKTTDSYTQQVSGLTYRGEFSTKYEISLGLTIKGIGYETVDIAKAYAYANVNTSTGYRSIGSDMTVYDK